MCWSVFISRVKTSRRIHCNLPVEESTVTYPFTSHITFCTKFIEKPSSRIRKIDKKETESKGNNTNKNKTKVYWVPSNPSLCSFEFGGSITLITKFFIIFSHFCFPLMKYKRIIQTIKRLFSYKNPHV